MAAIAEIRLSLSQQELVRQSLVGRMAAQAAQVVLAMGGARKVHMVFPRAVAFQTALVDLFRSCSLEAENLLGIGRIFYVTCSRPVAGFATVCFASTLRLQNAVPMARLLEPLVDVFVAAFAGFCSHIVGHRWSLLRSILGRLASGTSLCNDNGAQQQPQNCKRGSLTPAQKNHGFAPRTALVRFLIAGTVSCRPWTRPVFRPERLTLRGLQLTALAKSAMVISSNAFWQRARTRAKARASGSRCSCERPRLRRLKKSITSAARIRSAGCANQNPPLAPRRDSTKPAQAKDWRIFAVCAGGSSALPAIS